MKKTCTVFSVVLLVLLMAASAFAAKPFALKDTTWTGELTFVAGVIKNDDNVTLSLAEDNATLAFTDENGDFLAGTIKAFKQPGLDLVFTAIRDGRSLHLTAPGYLISAEIFMGPPTRKGVRPPKNIAIQGTAVDKGSLFLGTLTRDIP
jgi:hypothetical protein